MELQGYWRYIPAEALANYYAHDKCDGDEGANMKYGFLIESLEKKIE